MGSLKGRASAKIEYLWWDNTEKQSSATFLKHILRKPLFNLLYGSFWGLCGLGKEMQITSQGHLQKVNITCILRTDWDGRGGTSSFRGFFIRLIFHMKKLVERGKRNEHKCSRMSSFPFGAQAGFRYARGRLKKTWAQADSPCSQDRRTLSFLI